MDSKYPYSDTLLSHNLSHIISHNGPLPTQMCCGAGDEHFFGVPDFRSGLRLTGTGSDPLEIISSENQTAEMGKKAFPNLTKNNIVLSDPLWRLRKQICNSDCRSRSHIFYCGSYRVLEPELQTQYGGGGSTTLMLLTDQHTMGYHRPYEGWEINPGKKLFVSPNMVYTRTNSIKKKVLHLWVISWVKDKRVRRGASLPKIMKLSYLINL